MGASTYQDFYPTPNSLISRMLCGIDFRYIPSVLEPSAGKGDLADEVFEKYKYIHRFNSNFKPDIECIEINPDLRSVLTGKGYRVVHDDFLTYTTFRRYGLIIMNPPFSDGDKHLLKAIDMQKNGGVIVCLLNAETLLNQYTNTRKDLVRKLEEYNAEIKYIESPFASAERKTSVEIALIKIRIPNTNGPSLVLDYLEKAKDSYLRAAEQAQYSVVPSDIIAAVVAEYHYEAQAGCKLIQEFRAMQSVTGKGFNDDSESILSLQMNCHKGEVATETSYVRELRYKYWRALFQSDKFAGIFTSNLKWKYIEKIDELRDYEFSFHNIYQLRIDMNKQMLQGFEDAVVGLFDELSHKYHWYDETSKNIHYFNGWKTNKAWIINPKVIIPLNAYGSWDGRFWPTHGNTVEKLNDIEKVFDFLAGQITNRSEIEDTLKTASDQGQTASIQFKYFAVTFYKKGTCHIRFTDLDLLKKFNLYGSQSKNWLPPSYGKVKYKDMAPEEQAVIDSFEGQDSYERTLERSDYFFVKETNLMMLQGGVA